MTTPDVPLRMELTVEVPGTAEQVWRALASGDGISAWFLPTDLEERAGGAVCFHMGDETSEGTVTNWDPPRHLVIEEPNWAALTGHEGADVTPMVDEFLVEATSGGTCVVRVVASAFGTGADWEHEFFTDMERHWVPFFDHLRLYLTYFPGQRVTAMEINGDAVPGSADALRAAMRRALGVDHVGQTIEVRGITGEVDQLGDIELLVRVIGPTPGYLAFWAHDKEDGTAWPQLGGYFFSETAGAYVERETPAWKEWVQGLAAQAR